VKRSLAGVLLGACGVSAQVKIYWTATDDSGAYVVRANADGSNPTPIVTGTGNILGPNGLEYGNGRLYWPDQQLNAVQQVNPDGTGVTTFVQAQNPYDVFATAQQVHWASQEVNYIDVENADGTDYARVLASPDVNRPFAVELTVTHLYWSEVSGMGRIRRSDLNGANIVTLIPNAYVYDFQVTSKYIYFADNNYPSAIRRANLDGSGVTDLVPDFGFYNGICVTDDAIYWSAFNDANGGGIRRAGLDGSNPVNLYNAPAGTKVRGVVVLPETVAPVGPRFVSPTLRRDGFVFNLQVEVGKTCRIESSADLAEWTETTNFVSAADAVTLTNAIPEGARGLFYRARTP
jgi:hypothetical protein